MTLTRRIQPLTRRVQAIVIAICLLAVAVGTIILWSIVTVLGGIT